MEWQNTVKRHFIHRHFLSLLLTSTLIVLQLTLLSPAVVAASVWKVQHKDATLFLAGTIHVLRQKDSIPKSFNTAYQKSSHLLFETDMNALEGPLIEQFMMTQAVNTEGASLKKSLTPSTLKRLQTYCDAIPFPIDAMDHFKPGMIYMTLLGLELQKLGVNQTGVDKFFHKKALRDRKKTSPLESIEQHLAYLMALGDEDPEEFVSYFLDELKQLPTEIETLISAWHQGDLDKLNSAFITPMRKQHPKLYQLLLVQRNQAWLPQIERWLKTSETEMVLVGAAHLAGPDGLIQKLQTAGYSVKPF